MVMNNVTKIFGSVNENVKITLYTNVEVYRICY